MNFPIETPDLAELLPSLRNIVETTSQTAGNDRPILIHMMGIPGGGKSTLADAIAEVLKDRSLAMVGFDRMMKSLPEYGAETDIEKAFALYELPARAAGYLLVKKLFENRANFIFDHTGSDPRHIDLMRYAKHIGYKIALVRVIADPEIAKSRIKTRQAVEGRHTPLAYVDERLLIIDRHLDNFKSLVDIYAEIDNSNLPECARAAFFKDAAEKIVATITGNGSPAHPTWRAQPAASSSRGSAPRRSVP